MILTIRLQFWFWGKSPMEVNCPSHHNGGNLLSTQCCLSHSPRIEQDLSLSGPACLCLCCLTTDSVALELSNQRSPWGRGAGRVLQHKQREEAEGWQVLSPGWMCQPPRATNWMARTTVISSQFWRLEVQSQDVNRALLSPALFSRRVCSMPLSILPVVVGDR